VVPAQAVASINFLILHGFSNHLNLDSCVHLPDMQLPFSGLSEKLLQDAQLSRMLALEYAE
jgi:hypothetical protein